VKIRSSIVISLTILLATANSIAVAQGQNRAGTSAAPELMIPVGARYVALAGSATAIATGLEAIYWNPAGLDLNSGSATAMFSHRSYLADMSMNYFGVSGKSSVGTFALSFRSFSIGDIAVTTEDAPDGTGEILSPTFFVAGLSYSKQLSDRISVGVTANVISENFARVGATSIAFDVGVQYRGLFGFQGLAFGVAIKNVGPPIRYDGSGLLVQGGILGSDREITFYKVQAASFELPSVIELGLAYDFVVDDASRISVTGGFQNNNVAYDEYRIGLEYSMNEVFFVRGGYLFAQGSSDKAPSIFQNFTAGAGVNLGNVGGVDLAFDYAFIPVKFFDANHVISVKLGF
jgi:hypothetical protein